MLHSKRTRVIAALALMLVAAACTTTPDQSTAEATLCGSLATFQTDVQAVADLSPDSASVDDLNAATDAVSSSWDQVVTDAQAVSAADTAALTSAYNDLAQAIQDLPTDVAVTDALTTLQPSIDAVNSAYTEMANGLSCAS